MVQLTLGKGDHPMNLAFSLKSFKNRELSQLVVEVVHIGQD
jgi:hypothetical protein